MYLHEAHLANIVTSYCTCLGGLIPLVYCAYTRNQPRRWVAIASLVIFALIFVPTPLSPNPHTPATPSRSAMHVAPQSLLASLLRPHRARVVLAAALVYAVTA